MEGNYYQMIVKSIITIILLRISWTDLHKCKISKVDTVLLIILGTAGQTSIVNALAGGMVCAVIPEMVNLFFADLRGFGGGDIRLMFAAGWLLGADRGLCVLLVGGTGALIVSALYGVRRKKSIIRLAVPFGPFLALGILIMLWTL